MDATQLFDQIEDIMLSLRANEDLNGRTKAIILTKLEECQLWTTKL